MQAQIKRSNVYPFYKVEAEPPKRYKWSADKAWEKWDSVKHYVGMVGIGMWIGFLLWY